MKLREHPTYFKSRGNPGNIYAPGADGKHPDYGLHVIIPAADAERHDRESAAKDAVIDAAEIIHKGWHKFDDSFGGPYGECDGVSALLDALHALEAVRDE